MKKPLQILFSAAFILCILSALVFISYRNAKAEADQLIAPLQKGDDFYFYGSRLSVIRSITGQWGPMWEFHYEPPNYGVGPLTIGVSLLGDAKATNPEAALVELKRMRESNKTEQGGAVNAATRRD